MLEWNDAIMWTWLHTKDMAHGCPFILTSFLGDHLCCLLFLSMEGIPSCWFCLILPRSSLCTERDTVRVNLKFPNIPYHWLSISSRLRSKHSITLRKGMSLSLSIFLSDSKNPLRKFLSNTARIAFTTPLCTKTIDFQVSRIRSEGGEEGPTSSRDGIHTQQAIASCFL